MTDDPKHIVISGYDTCGRRYNAARAQDPIPEIEGLVEELSPDATVLDIGCGAGVPVTSALARVCKVVGVDISSVQIEQARLNVPQATFMLGVTMYWSHFERSWYASALRELGFEVLAESVLGHGYRGVPGLPPERHPVVFARLERSRTSAASLRL